MKLFSPLINPLSDVYIFNRTDTTLTKITNDIYDDHEPVFSPNERKYFVAIERCTEKKAQIIFLCMTASVLQLIHNA